MKLFSWIHEKLTKASHADSNKTSSAGSALHSSCESYASDLKEKKAPKCSTSGRQLHEFELCLSGCCLGVDDPFENEFQAYQDRISVIVSHAQFGLLAIGTFGVNSFEGEPEFESLMVNQLAVQPELIKKKHLEDSPTGVFGLDKGEDEVQIRLFWDFPAYQDGPENITTFKNSKLLTRGSRIDQETSSLNKRNCPKVIGSQGGKKVHPFNKTESSATNYEAIAAASFHIKEKLRDKPLKHCRILGSCFGSSVESAQKKGAIKHDYSIPRKKSLSSRLKTILLSSEKYSAGAMIAAQDSTQAHDRYQITKTSRNTTGEKELQSRKTNEHACSRVTGSDLPVTWTAVSKDVHQKHLPIPRHDQMQPRERALRNPVNENWIKTDSEYVVLECL